MLAKNKSTILFYICCLAGENKYEWKFKITKDEKHPILLEFDTHGNTRKRSTPSFLMALLIKKHLKIIKKEIEEKVVDKLGFCLFDDFNEEETERIKIQLQESCKLLKIGFELINIK